MVNQMPATLYRMRRNTRLRQYIQTLTAWSAGISVTQGEYVTNANNVYQAQSTGTTGATPPTQDRGAQSDGTITWIYTDPQVLLRQATQ
jgi:hypothetical protein